MHHSKTVVMDLIPTKSSLVPRPLLCITEWEVWEQSMVDKISGCNLTLEYGGSSLEFKLWPIM